MSDHFPILIPGAEPSGDVANVTAPFDQSSIATVDRADEASVETALAAAFALFSERDRWLRKAERIDILENAAQIMQQRRNELALEAAREGGKPLPDSLVETDRAIDGVKCCVETLRTRAGAEIPMGLNGASAGRYASTYHEPIGPVLAFSAFNHPLNLIVHQVGPAVAAGCPVIVKPAEATPLSCFRFVSILREAGLPAEWCQACLPLNRSVSGKMVADQRIAFFTFIGSGRVGWMLRSQLAPGTRCALEHGGAAPVVVTDNADLDDAIPLLVKGGLYHAGQVCVSVQRVFAQRNIAESLARRIADAAAELHVGDPTLPESDVGPLIRPAEVKRVGDWVAEAIESGGELLCGGKPVSETCFEPTVLLNPSEKTKVSTQEIFGPVIAVYSFDDLDDAIRRANALPFSFQASVFTKNLDIAFRASRRLNAAAVIVNDHTAFRVDWMPFAGFKESGYGTGGIPYTMQDMQVEKMVVFRSPEL